MQLSIYQVDAFTDRVFGGNPAAVVPLASWLDEETMQAVAAENNLSETAFFVREPEGYRIRWFTPVAEIDLCGHATLAAAWVLFREIAPGMESVEFASASGPLGVTLAREKLVMDFPSWEPEPVDAPEGLLAGLGGPRPLEVLGSRDYLVVYEHANQVRALNPNFSALSRLDRLGVIVTAPGQTCDFVSRFFVPSLCINEDPVTGSAHSTLVPYWSRTLGRSELLARQVSARGGELACRHLGDRVEIAGQAVLYMKGTIHI